MLIVTIHHGILGDGYARVTNACASDIDPGSAESLRAYVCEYHDMHDDDVDEIIVIKNGNVTPFVTHHFDREALTQ